MANAFECLSVVVLRLDFSKIGYGEVMRSETKWVNGDDAMTTQDMPTIKNEGNQPMDIWIESSVYHSETTCLPSGKSNIEDF